MTPGLPQSLRALLPEASDLADVVVVVVVVVGFIIGFAVSR